MNVELLYKVVKQRDGFGEILMYVVLGVAVWERPSSYISAGSISYHS
jgi:hypothetical protein